MVLLNGIGCVGMDWNILAARDHDMPVSFGRHELPRNYPKSLKAGTSKNNLFLEDEDDLFWGRGCNSSSSSFFLANPLVQRVCNPRCTLL